MGRRGKIILRAKKASIPYIFKTICFCRKDYIFSMTNPCCPWSPAAEQAPHSVTSVPPARVMTLLVRCVCNGIAKGGHLEWKEPFCRKRWQKGRPRAAGNFHSLILMEPLLPSNYTDSPTVGRGLLELAEYHPAWRLQVLLELIFKILRDVVRKQ